MAKSNPIGVRFDLGLLEKLKEDEKCDTPQQAVNFLTEFYRQNREKIDFKKLFEESSLFKERASVKEDSTKKKRHTKEASDDPNKGLSKGEILKRMREQNL